MSSIKNLYENALKYEHSSLAHYIAHLIREGKISFDDDVAVLDFTQADHSNVSESIKRNELCFSLIKAFSLKYSDMKFTFIFARNQQEAIDYFKKIFKFSPKNCHEYPMDFVIEKGNRFISFRDLKRECAQFPTFIGYYEREMVYQ
ncbi:hypothetical protein [Cytobacillus praedii]|uniref:Uncharacterized protein n=1 Tax=Cytobacillus praedii TaxID=1742358 RepID=A0A4R1B481_9BACI|nr:hypothetical protein [Cytobacillus praedii]TCJ04877.1 hypothetical protein E0Y62_06555 [Cytobacillus praedii]